MRNQGRRFNFSMKRFGGISLFIGWCVIGRIKMAAYTTVERGSRNTLEYRMFFKVRFKRQSNPDYVNPDFEVTASHFISNGTVTAFRTGTNTLPALDTVPYNNRCSGSGSAGFINTLNPAPYQYIQFYKDQMRFHKKISTVLNK
jgi:hypothetical protein